MLGHAGLDWSNIIIYPSGPKKPWDKTTDAFKTGSTQKDPFVVEFKTACPRNGHPTILKLRAYGAMTSPINFNLLLVVYKTWKFGLKKFIHNHSQIEN